MSRTFGEIIDDYMKLHDELQNKVFDEFICAERVAVVRCKECKHWLPHEQFGYDADNDEYHNYCGRLVPDDDYYAFTREADEFCSRAERKDNG